MVENLRKSEYNSLSLKLSLFSENASSYLQTGMEPANAGDAMNCTNGASKLYTLSPIQPISTDEPTIKCHVNDLNTNNLKCKGHFNVITSSHYLCENRLE